MKTKRKIAGFIAVMMMFINVLSVPAFGDSSYAEEQIHEQDRMLKQQMSEKEVNEPLNIGRMSSGATQQTLGGGGEPYQITVYNDGRVGVWKLVDGQYTEYQYYNQRSNGTALHFKVDGVQKSYLTSYLWSWAGSNNPNAKQFTYGSVTKDGRTATTTFMTSDGVTVEQVVEYSASNAIKRSWTVKNENLKSISDVKIINGGDTYFAGSDSGYCYYDNLNNMVYIKKNENYGIMGFSGDASSPADRYYSGSYSRGASQATIGQLSNETYSSLVDAGYYLQWNKDSIPSGINSSWTVSGSERFTEKGKVQIINPSPKTTSNGSMVSYRFGLQNMGASEVNVELAAQSINRYPVNIRLTDGVRSDANGKITVSIPANGSKNVVVDCEIPDNAPDGSSDKITLTAKYLDGSNNIEQGSATNTVINYIQPAIARVSVIEKTDAVLKAKVIFKNLTGNNIIVLAEILDEQGRKVTTVPSQDKSVAGAGANEAEVTFDFNISNLEYNKTYYVRAMVAGISEPNDSASFRKDGQQIIAVKTITIVPSTLMLAKTETRALAASILPENATNKNVQWYSSDNMIATVDAVTGVVTGKNDGIADIYAIAKDGSGVKGKCTLTVKSPPERIEMNPVEKTLTVGDVLEGTVNVSAIVLPEAYILSQGQITWELLDNDGGYVTKSEATLPEENQQSVKITAVKATPVGATVKIKASIGEFSATTQIKVVNKQPTDITMKSGSVAIDLNGLIMQSTDTKNVTVELTPTDAKLDPADLIWSTNRDDLLNLTPSKSSLSCDVISKGTAGEAMLTARVNGTAISKTVTVKIEKKVENFEIIPANITNAVNGQEINFGVKYTPEDATNKGITWSITEGSTHASIDQNGKLTVNTNALANQLVTINASLTDDMTKVKTHTITTKAKLDSISIGNGPSTLSVGQKVDYAITYIPPEVEEAMKGITWSIIDPNMAVTYNVLSENTIEITVKEDAKPGGIQIKAVSKYDPNIAATCDVAIIQDAIDYKITNGTDIVTPTNGYYNKNITLEVIKPSVAGYDSVYIDGVLAADSKKVFTTDGEHKVRIYAKKADGAVTNTKEIIFNIDNVKPNLGVEGYSIDKWYSSFVNLTVTSSDTTSGIDQATLKVTHNGVTSPIIGSTYTVAENGLYTFDIFDKAGNQAKFEVTIKMDKVKPTVSSLELVTTNIPLANLVQSMMLSSTPDIVSNKQVTIKAKAVDKGGSGISKVQYMLVADSDPNSAVWVDFGSSSGNDIYEANITKAFTGTVKVRVIDGASNISDELTKTAVITDAKPSTPVISTDKSAVVDANKWVTDGDVIVTVTSVDASGLGGEVWYKTSGATAVDWTKYITPITVSTEGKTTVYAKVKYSTGTESDESVKAIKIDKTAPTTPTILLKDSDGTALSLDKITKKDVNMTITSGADSGVNGSGFDKTEYYIKSGTVDINGAESAWSKFTSADKIVTLRNEGIYTIRSRTYDMAGNISVEATETFTIDRNQPKVPVLKVTKGSGDFDETNWSNDTLQIEIIPDVSNTANIAKMEYEVYRDGTTSTETYTECTAVSGKYSVDIADEGVSHFKARVVLKNGNNSQIAQKTVRIDKTAPSAPTFVVLESYEADGRTMKADVEIIYNGDNLSGLQSIEGIKYQIDGGESQVYTKSFGITMPGGTTSSAKIKVDTEIYDKAGNKVIADKTIELVYSELNMNGVGLSTTGFWMNEDVTVSLDQNKLIESIEGKTIKTIKYQMTGAESRNWTDVVSGSAILGSPVSTDGITKVQIEVTFTDDSKYTSGTKEIRIDKVDPTFDLTCVKLDINNNTKEDKIVIAVNPIDTMSQIKAIELPDGKTVAGQTADFTVYKNGTYTFITYDNAGNMTEYSVEVGNFAEKAKALDNTIKEIITEIEELLEKKPDGTTNGGYLDDLVSIQGEIKKIQDDIKLVNDSTTDTVNKGMVDAGLIENIKDFEYNVDSKIEDIKENIKNSPLTEEVLQTVPTTEEGLKKVVDKVQEILDDMEHLDTSADKEETKDKLLDKVSDILSKIPDDSTLDTSDLGKIQSDLAKDLDIQFDITTGLKDLKKLSDSISDKSTVKEIEDIFNKIKEKVEKIISDINKLPKEEQNKNKEDLLNVITEITNKIKTLSPEQKTAADSTGATDTLEKVKEDLKVIDEEKAEKEAEDITAEIGKLPSAEDVSSDDKKSIEELITKIDDLIKGDNLKEDTKTKLEENKKELEKLLDQIEINKSALEKAISEIEERIKKLPSLENLNKSHKQDVENLIKKINDTKNNKELTQDQKIYLATELGKLNVILDVILDVAGEEKAEKEAEDITIEIKKLPSIENVSSDNKKTIEDLITKIDNLIKGDNLKEDIKSKLEENKKELQKLLEQIEANKAAAEKVVSEIEEGIKKLPSLENLNETHKQDVENLIQKVNETKNNKELSQEQKNYLVSELSKLDEMLKKINDMSDSGDGSGGGSGGSTGGGSTGAPENTAPADKDAGKVNDAIKDFTDNVKKGDLTLEDKGKIDDMLKEFDKLTDKQKKQIPNYEELVKYAEQMKTLTECLDTKNSLFINAADNMGFVKGYEDNTIRPDANITRAESASMIYRLLKAKGIVVDKKFVDSDMWAGDAIEGLAKLNILSGYEDGTFKPDNDMTRAEFITMLAKVLGIEPIDVNDKFSDITGHWASKYINGFSLLGYSKGYEDGSFQPNAPISRAEAIVMINRVIGIDATETQNVENGFSDLPQSHWAYKEIMTSIIR